MGTKMEFKSSLPGYYPIRDLNKDFNSCGGPLYFTDWIFPNRPSYHKISSKDSADAYRGNDRDVLKQTMLEHEAIFKYQVHELHRLYRIQRDLMNEGRRREYCRNHTTGDASFTSSPLASLSTSEEIRKCLEANSSSARLSCVIDNHSSLKDFEGLASRPGKVRRKMFDLQLPADEYIDLEEEEHFDNDGASGEALGVDLSGKPMLQLLDLQRNGCQNTIEINRGGTFLSMLEAGYSKSKEKVPISSMPMQAFCSKVNETQAFYLDDKWKEHQQKDGPVYDMQFGERSHKGADSKYQFSPFHSGKARPMSLSLCENMNLNAVCCQLHPSSNTGTSFHECSYSTSYNFSKDDNFNGVITSRESNEEEQRSKQEKHPLTFSWLRVMPAAWNEAENSGRFSKMEEVSIKQSQLPDSWNIEKISDRNLTQNIKSRSSTCSEELLGFPILEPKNNKSLSSALNDGSPSRSSNGEAKDKCKAIEFDINLSDSEEGKRAIDLNSCFIADDERVVAEIDLECAALQKNEENIISRVEAMEKNEDVVTMAAEAIVAISLLSCDHPSDNAAKNLPEDSSGNPLNWFAEIVLCGGDELQEEEKDEDFFEMMTLRLTETNKEEHRPPPLVLKEAKFEERRPTKLLNRGQKGQTRRARQQRDFQRDILPAVVSLSRQKVNEDIQIFDGIMREIGHLLPSGLARRNSKKNNHTSPPSRRRTIITTPARTILGLDNMHLKGWGKTTRRPSRQRYAGGNPHHIQGQD